MAVLLNPIGVEVGLRYVIVGPDGTRAVFNDTTDPDFVGFLDGEDGVTGLERAGVRSSVDSLPEADGQIHGAFRYEGLSFTLKGIIPPDASNGGSWVERQAKLLRATAAMRADARLFWTPTSAPPVQVSFRQAQPTRITKRRPKACLVTGIAERHVVESQALQSSTLEPGAVTAGGLASPLTSPFASNASSVGAFTVTTDGHAEAWPIVTFTGPITNPSLENRTLGPALRFIYTLGAGETLVVDTDPRRRTIRLNSQANRYSALDWTSSTWWPLLPGANALLLGAASFSAGSSVAVQWRDAWG